jgi:hypothetical protein
LNSTWKKQLEPRKKRKIKDLQTGTSTPDAKNRDGRNEAIRLEGRRVAPANKGDEGKVKAARRLRQETPVSLKRIAQRLHMGSWTHVSNLLHEKSHL